MRKLVIIDDDPLDHFMMKYIMRDRNHFDTTTYTVYGSLVLDYIEENKCESEKLPDVIFLDLNMPEFSGWEFLRRMEEMQHEVDKNIQVYIISSSIREMDKEATAKYPFVSDFISKPIDVSEIEQIVGVRQVD